MSMLASLTHETVVQLQLQMPDVHHSSITAAGAGGDGILDWLTAKNTTTQKLLRAASITAAIIFVLLEAIRSRMAMARVIIAGVAAGLLVWIVFNVTSLQDRVGNEVESSPATTRISQPADVLA